MMKNCRILFFCFLLVSTFVDAQNKETYSSKREKMVVEMANIKEEPTEKMANAKSQHLAAWHKSPYLNVPLEEATVGELTLAFKKWRKANAQAMPSGKRHKDDDVVKYQRKLYNWQLENSFDEVTASNQEKLDAFTTYEAQNAHQSTSSFSNVDGNWRLLGPLTKPIETSYYEVNDPELVSQDNTGLGRINCLEFSVWDTMNIWAGTSTGGVWKTWNGGKTWINISMNLPIMEISDIAIDQNNSNIIYLATGDRDGQGGWYGNGSVASQLYKTTDGGDTWNRITANFGTGNFIEGLYTHPNRTNEVVVVKTSGVYKSKDGGATWAKPLTFNAQAGVYLANTYANAANPERLYALTRDADFVISLNRSDDFGTTWQRGEPINSAINNFDFFWTSIRMSVAPSDANCVYIVSLEFDTTYNATRFGIMLRTLNGGQTFEDKGRYPKVPNTFGWILGDSTDIGSQDDYNIVLTIDPKNKDKVFVGGVDMWGSMDGGNSFHKSSFWTNSAGESVHADHHWGEYQPISGSYFLATDGGIFKTKDLQVGNNDLLEDCKHGIDDFNKAITTVFKPGCYQFPTKWEYVSNGISNNEFYAIAVSKSNPSMIMAGAQDNGTLLRRDGNWYSVYGGDGFVPMIHPTNPNTFYASIYFGWLSRTDDGGKTYRDVSKDMDTLDQGNWLTPTEMFESNPNTIFQCRDNLVFRTTNAGNSWEIISNFPESAFHQVNTAMGISQSNVNVLSVARIIIDSAGGPIKRYLFRTTDGGVTWQNVWSPTFPGQVVLAIKIHPTQPDKMWISFTSGFAAANPNQSKKVFYTADGGKTWTNISNGLPPVPVWSIAVQEDSDVDALYVGTAIGVFYKDNTMSNFVEWQVGMPRGVRITDLKIHTASGKIYAGTHGRGLWVANLHDRAYDAALARKRNNSYSLNVFPNPAQNAIVIEWDEKKTAEQSLDIVDMYGKIIFQKTDFQSRATIDMTAQANGIYFIRLKTGNEVVSKKLVLAK
jgi:photosystem II stability/assembly factor-like uncharacterized protein